MLNMKLFLAEQLNLSGKISQSLHGEDILLWRYFKNVKDGFFIDIGAYCPKLFNNTWRLRKKLGFRGINIEPTDRIKLFKRYRKDDINLQCLIGNKNTYEWFYYDPEHPASSGKDISKAIPVKKMLIKQRTLTSIVNEYEVKKIDLLDIDVEGTEFEVLDGYDWSVLPKLILIEENGDKRINKLLTGKGYKVIAITPLNTLYEIIL